MLASLGLAQQAPTAGPYKVLKTVKVGGDGGFDYVYADAASRRFYVPRSGPTARVSVYDLDTLEPVSEIPNVSGHGAAVDPKSDHGFVTSKPVVMWDSKTLAIIKTIDAQGEPDGILFDPFNQHVYISATPPLNNRDQHKGWSSVERSIWAGRRSRPSPMARAMCMWIWKTRARSRWWTPKHSR